MGKRLNVYITVLSDGRGKVDSIRVTLKVKGMRGWSKRKQTQLSNMLSDYALNEKRK